IFVRFSNACNARKPSSTVSKKMNVRSATPNDISLIFSMIQQKAEFDRNLGAFSGVLGVSEEKLFKTLFGTVPFAYVLFAEVSERAIGFALYGFRYSSFAGQPSIWLDDLYVEEDRRRRLRYSHYDYSLC
ncbi:MAG: hypothetical protein QXM56_04835, partial [Acidilobaceae archaeon]